MAINTKYVSPIAGGRQLLIGDVHGCAYTLKALLGKIDLTPDDQLFFLGDYINKGPDSKGVLDQLITLKNSEMHVFFLRGNNEDYFYKTLKKGQVRLLRLADKYKVESLFKFKGSQFNIRKKYRKFLKSTYHYIESDNFYAVHAGFDFKSEIPYHNAYGMLWMRNFKANKKLQNYKQVIRGHKVTSIKQIKKAVKKGKYDIPIDNGCFLGNRDPEFGHLVCFDFTNQKLIIQENSELPTPILKK